jgi:mono/diheme cytochrome c family protein
MKTAHVMFACGLLACSVPSLAQELEPAAARGMTKFQHSCAPCHGRGPGDDGRALLPGTDALRLKYQGSLPAVLEDRTDLSAEAISVFVRQGSMSMPPFRKTELMDAEIVDIAAYLRYSSTKAAQ